jgi:hypothetical protein
MLEHLEHRQPECDGEESEQLIRAKLCTVHDELRAQRSHESSRSRER